MKIKSAQLIYFSAAGTTEQTARLIGEGLALPTHCLLYTSRCV